MTTPMSALGTRWSYKQPITLFLQRNEWCAINDLAYIQRQLFVEGHFLDKASRDLFIRAKYLFVCAKQQQQ